MVQLRAEWRRLSTLARARWLLGTLLGVVIVLLLVGDPDGGIPDRLAEGKPLRPTDYRRTWGWYAGAVNAGALALLLASARAWAGHGNAAGIASLAPPPRSRHGQRGLHRLQIGAVAATAVLAGTASLRLDHSFWRDEEMTVDHYVDGGWYRNREGEYRFHSLRWAETLWNYDTPNNHVGYSFLARVSQDVYNGLVERGPFASEAAVRMPAWIAGSAGVLSIAWLLWRLGEPGAALLAAWLAALHPWWMRYASEARGYAVLLLAATAVPALLVRALERGSWGRWIAFAVAECGAMWVNPSLAFLLLPVNLCGLFVIWRAHRGQAALAQQLPRLVVSNVLAALAFLQLMLPNLVQVGGYLERTRGTRDLVAFLIPESLSHLLAGMPWHHHHGSDPAVYPELVVRIAEAPAVFWLFAAALAVVMVAGCFRAARRGPLHAGLVASYLVAAPFAWLVGALRRDPLYPWYFVFALPGLLFVAGLGLESLRVRIGRIRPAAGAGFVLAFFAAFLWLSMPVRAALIERAIKSERDSVLLTRPTLEPRARENAAIVTVQFPDRPQFYDPRMITVDSLELFERVIAGAEREGQALFVNCGRLHHARKHRPELVERVEQPDFERIAVLPGLGPDSTRIVYRWKGRG